MSDSQLKANIKVARRVGGLEMPLYLLLLLLDVARRVGGLEKESSRCNIRSQVARRVGGLESMRFALVAL